MFDEWDSDNEYGQYWDDYREFENQCAWEDALADSRDWDWE
jgi:hypothetical protein